MDRTVTPIVKLQQRLNREQLKLARLKKQANKERESERRLKIKLGTVPHALLWQKVDDRKINELIERVALLTQNTARHDEFKILSAGFNAANTFPPLPVQHSDTSAERYLKIIEEKILLGERLKKENLESVNSDILNGAILSIGVPD